MLIDFFNDLFHCSKVIIQVFIKNREQSHFNEFTLLPDDVEVIIFLIVVESESTHIGKMLSFTRNL